MGNRWNNESTAPESKEEPYFVEIKDEDILPPTITNVQPKEGAILEDTNTKPTIRAEYEDPSGIDTESVEILVDSVDVTEKSIVTEEYVTYTQMRIKIR